MALRGSLNEHNMDKSYENVSQGIEMTDIAIDNYDLLGESRDEHVYSTAAEPATVGLTTNSSDTANPGSTTNTGQPSTHGSTTGIGQTSVPSSTSNNSETSNPVSTANTYENISRSSTDRSDIRTIDCKPHSKEASNVSGSRRIELSNNAVVIALIGILVFCILICTISGVVVYHVIDANNSIPPETNETNVRDQLTGEIESLRGDFITLNDKFTVLNLLLESMTEKHNASETTPPNNSVDIEQRLGILENMTDTIQDTLQTVQQKQNSSEITSRDDHSNIDSRLVALENEVKILQQNLNSSETTASDYRDVIARRLDALDKLVQAAQPNTSSLQVAFTAHTATGKEVDNALTFDHVDLNAGDGYSQANGTFRCPVAGMYVFTATLLIRDPTFYSVCYIKKNASNIAMVSSGSALTSASVSVFAHLSVGDFVNLGSCVYLTNVRKTHLYSSFTGSLIQAD